MTKPLTNTLLDEIEHEALATGKLLDRIPQGKLDWRPHPKSMSLGELALHVATIPAALAASLQAGGAIATDLLTHPAAASIAEIHASWSRTLAYLRQNPITASDGEWAVQHAGKVGTTPLVPPSRTIDRLSAPS